jgi:hypothetical protein
MKIRSVVGCHTCAEAWCWGAVPSLDYEEYSLMFENSTRDRCRVVIAKNTFLLQGLTYADKVSK